MGLCITQCSLMVSAEVGIRIVAELRAYLVAPFDVNGARHLMHSYSTTVILSGAQPPWKPNGTRTGRRIVATGSPAKS
jgi:hypothetical protein